jgi:aldehyde dehydrogenase (NAD+)
VSIGGEEGERLATGGNRLRGGLADGYFIEPTVFCDVPNAMTIVREEIFGPVISVIPFDSADEGLRRANDTEYGLGGTVWMSSVKTMSKMLHGSKAAAV